jgi:hypothetical protein
LTKNGELAPEAIDLLPPGVEDDHSFRLDGIEEADIPKSGDEPGALEYAFLPFCRTRIRKLQVFEPNLFFDLRWNAELTYNGLTRMALS